MPKEILYATGMFEMGDQFYDDTGRLRTVTNILVCHNMRRGTFKVLYELDESGRFEEVAMQGFFDTTQNNNPVQKKKPTLQFTNAKKPKDPFFNGGE